MAQNPENAPYSQLETKQPTDAQTGYQNFGADADFANEASEVEKTSNLNIGIMMLKGALGLGIFTLPELSDSLGFYGVALIYTLTFGILTVFIFLMVHVANEIQYKGRR